MSTVVDQLVDMGFDRVRVEYAYEQTGKGPLEKIYTCPFENFDDMLFRCNKLFRDENGMMFHATKSGHENFSESTETIASLTSEERAKKAAELRERIKIARAQKEEAERKEEVPTLVFLFAWPVRFTSSRAIAEERRREKQEEAAARQRVLEQIRIDRLSAVRLWLEINHSDGSPFTLLMPFPRKVITEEDYDKPLKELGLYCSLFTLYNVPLYSFLCYLPLNKDSCQVWSHRLISS
uniref:UBX domain-containing protein n=1 Tax=Angiostrongylus cantonensis TaxID=6313 RepID=A0A0K0D9G5_ANGCA